jgi:osmotically-inducible protein OsmY
LTLRGPVKTAAEKDLIYRKANAVAGTGNVDDQLEIIR